MQRTIPLCLSFLGLLTSLAASPLPQDDSKKPAEHPAEKSTKAAPQVSMPFGGSIKVDGKLQKKEWADAKRIPMGTSGKLLVKHDGKDVCLAIQAGGPGCGSVHIQVGDKILVLHASARMGTAEYHKKKGAWQIVRRFKFKKWDQAEHYKTEGWVSSLTTRDGEDMEYRVSLLSLGLARTKKDAKANKPIVLPRMQVIYGFPGGIDLAWPTAMADRRNGTQLHMGNTPKTVGFRPVSWPEMHVSRKSVKGEVSKKAKSRKSRKS